MVECSPALQKLQHQSLKCVDEDNTIEGVGKRSLSTLTGTPVSWHAALEQVPSGCMTLTSRFFFSSENKYMFSLWFMKTALNYSIVYVLN